jgi:choline dehydrogenase-like flavoprotein
MIIDSRELTEGTVFEADICIVGAGPAGITLACEMLDSGLSIVVLEAGSLAFDKRAQEGLWGELEEGTLHSPPHMYRRRVLGGTSSIWGGRCVPLDPIDLERRNYVPKSGWPIPWEELERYYLRAQPYFEAGAFDYSVSTTLGTGAPETIEGFQDPDILADRIERFSPPTDFGKRYCRTLAYASNVKLLLSAEALHLVAPASVVKELEAVAGGKRIRVRSKRCVLAAGGLETPRLLMLSDLTRRGGFGNEGGALGRFYMCHLENTLGRLQLTPKERPITLHFERSVDGVYVRRKLGIAAESQRRHGLLNTTFRFHHPLISDPSHRNGTLSAVYLLKDAVLPEYRRKLATIEIANRDKLHRNASLWLAHGVNVVREAPAVALFCIDWTCRRILAKRKLPFVVVSNRHGCYPLDVNAEQIPNSDSCVLLGQRTDHHGRRLLRVDWRTASQDLDSLVRTMRLLQRGFALSGVARLDCDEDALQDAVSASTPVGGHHIGTTRMADIPRDGVVDSNCAVHGIKNLYCVGSAVFPTCGHANPTLTIVALAVRLADHLKADFQRRPAGIIVAEAAA